MKLMEHNEPLSTRDLVLNDPATGGARRSRRDPEADEPMGPEPSPGGAGDQESAGVASGQDEQPSQAASSSSVTQVAPQAPPSGGRTGDEAPLLSHELTADYQRRWEEVQTRFVDEPRGAVQDADGLVATVMHQLAEGFARERAQLEAQWDRGEDISTEDLRVALTRYRSFFQRLLAT
jgi:hypothetical protein